MSFKSEYLAMFNPSPQHDIAPIHVSKKLLERGPHGDGYWAESIDPQELVGKPFRAGHRSFRIDRVDVDADSLIIHLGREYR